MERRDIIKDEIEQVGKVIGRAIASFLGLKDGDTREAIEKTNKELASDLDLDIHLLVQLELPELEKYIESKNMTEHHLDQLSNYLYEVAVYEKKEGTRKDAMECLNAAKNLLRLADEKTNTLTFERMTLIRNIQNELK